MKRAPLPKSCACLTLLYDGSLFSVSNWRCGGGDSPGREDELCDADRIVVTRRGSFELTVRGVPHFVDPLVVTFWNRGEYFRVRHPVSAIDECTVFRLTERGSHQLREYMGHTQKRAAPFTFAHSVRPIDGMSYLRHRTALHAVRQHAHLATATHHAIDALHAEEQTLSFLRHAINSPRAMSNELSKRAQSQVVSRAREIVSSQFTKPLSVTQIANEANCSPFHLSRLFRAQTGMTLHRAVMQLRLREGLERMLDERNRDEREGLSSVALDTGFASHSHFTDAFRAEYGCAPSAARRVLCQN
ncbi:MAG: helix-turn-helix domain-containing protein [Gemmatimonas sp.]